MPIELRPITRDEFPEMVRVMGLSFGFDPPEDDHFAHILPFDRTVCAFEDGRMVGTAAAFSLAMTVPGAVVPCGGTTVVAVLPSHRRRGVLRRMIRAHLDEIRARGEPIAALWASDSAIYGRFGYGEAAVEATVKVERPHVAFHRSAPDPAPVRIIEREEAARVLPPFHDSIRDQTPGFFRRSTEWWEHRLLADEKSRREGATSFRWGVVDGVDGIAGYLQYRFKSAWEGDHGSGELRIFDLVGTDPESWSGLWTFALNHDLTSTITAYHRSTDDPLFDLLAGTRRVGAKTTDSLWVRIMDVPRALEARSYSAPIEMVLEVHDPMGDTDGRYRLVASPEGAECSPTDEEASITLDAEDLGAIYLGRSRLRALSRSGRVQGDAVSLAAADTAFTWDPQPWCPEVF